MGGEERVRKLRWLCRRGMKELDILLERFVIARSEALARGEWPRLETLLQTEDDRLWDWFQEPELADSPELRELLVEIRDCNA